MNFLPSHVFTPAALITDERFGPVVPSGELGSRCVACEVPPEEHVDQAVLASYADAVQSGASVRRVLSCGHPGIELSRGSLIWTAPHRGMMCAECSGPSAIAEYVVSERAA